jgi:hypothetical protein
MAAVDLVPPTVSVRRIAAVAGSEANWRFRPVAVRRSSRKPTFAAGKRPLYGITLHSNILLAIGAATWLMKAMRA